jgi:hypothetical protein
VYPEVVVIAVFDCGTPKAKISRFVPELYLEPHLGESAVIAPIHNVIPCVVVLTHEEDMQIETSAMDSLVWKDVKRASSIIEPTLVFASTESKLGFLIRWIQFAPATHWDIAVILDSELEEIWLGASQLKRH